MQSNLLEAFANVMAPALVGSTDVATLPWQVAASSVNEMGATPGREDKFFVYVVIYSPCMP